MISESQFQTELNRIIENAIREDVGPGDYSSLSCIPDSATGKAKLLVKENGIIAGVEFAKMIFNYVDPNLQIETFINDGTPVKYGDVVFHVSGSSQSILKSERVVLNSMQRMSAIATKTNSYVELLKGTNAKSSIPEKLPRVSERQKNGQLKLAVAKITVLHYMIW